MAIRTMETKGTLLQAFQNSKAKSCSSPAVHRATHFNPTPSRRRVVSHSDFEVTRLENEVIEKPQFNDLLFLLYFIDIFNVHCQRKII